MYSSFRIQNYRCFEDLELTDLARINLIAGRNNVGKSSLLEALFMFSNPYNPELTLAVNAFRGITQFMIEFGKHQGRTPWDTLFRGFDTEKVITFSGKGSWTLRVKLVRDSEELAKAGPVLQQNGDMPSLLPEAYCVLKLEATKLNEDTLTHYMILGRDNTKQISPIPPSMGFDAVFLPAKQQMTPDNRDKNDAKRFSNLVRLRKVGLLVETLGIIEDRLNGLEYLDDGIYGDLKGIEQLIPIAVMGDGLTSLMRIVLAMGYAAGGAVFIDEIENGLHYTVQVDIWKAIAKAAHDFNVQVFATTHSLEMIKAAHEAFKNDDPYDFRLHRLERDEKLGKIVSLTFDKELMEATAAKGFEVRG